MIYLGKVAPSLEQARRTAEELLISGEGYRKFKEVIKAQGGEPRVSTSSNFFRTRQTFERSPAQGRDTSAASMLV